MLFPLLRALFGEKLKQLHAEWTARETQRCFLSCGLPAGRKVHGQYATRPRRCDSLSGWNPVFRLCSMSAYGTKQTFPAWKTQWVRVRNGDQTITPRIAFAT